MMAIVYPKVGSILSYVGAFAGFIIIYLIPVLTYLKMLKTEYENPVLAKAIQNNEFTVDKVNTISSPKIVVSNRHL